MPKYIATLTDGSTIIDENLYERGQDFNLVLNANKAGLLHTFRVFLDDGGVFGVDLLTGQFEADGSVFTPASVPSTPLRIIYYKTMQAFIGDTGVPKTTLKCITIGWQTTVDGKNVRAGVKVYPHKARYELTEGV